MELKYQNQTISVVSKIENGDLISTLNGNNLKHKIEKINENSYYIWIDGKNKNAFVSNDNKSVLVWIDGYSFKFDSVDKEHSDYQDKSNNLNRQEVIAPMPGSVVKIMAELGQSVEESQPLIIIEAMKMETTLYSQISGVVKEINCKEKEQVDSDKILIVIEKES